MKITLQAKSSYDPPYAADFLVAYGKLTVHCDCNAGIFGQICQHKTEVLAGDASRLYDLAQAGDPKRIQDILAGSSDIHDPAAAIALAERVIREKQAEVKARRNRFADLLAEGINIAEEAT